MCLCVCVSVCTLLQYSFQRIAIYQVSKYTTVECSARQSSITLNFEFPCRDPPQTCTSFKRFCGFHTQFCNWCWQNSAICACGVDLCWLESLWQAPPTAFSLADAIGISSAAFASVLVNVARLHYGNSMEFDGSTLVFQQFLTEPVRHHLLHIATSKAGWLTSAASFVIGHEAGRFWPGERHWFDSKLQRVKANSRLRQSTLHARLKNICLSKMSGQ